MSGEHRLTGWSDAVMDESELLLSVLIEAGYTEATGNIWNFTDKGAARAMELDPEPGVDSRGEARSPAPVFTNDA